ncbi:hemophore-related protein [Mycolicibacterium sp. Y3]
MKLKFCNRIALSVLAAGGALSAVVLAPIASADPVDCSRQSIDATVQQTTGAAQGYLGAHPGAKQAVSVIYTQPRDVASASIRTYFTANPQEYLELRSILAPIGDKQRACNTTALSPEMASAYSEFMAG